MKYWNKQGKYQKLYDQLYKELVPAEGKAETEDGEILRALSNVYYDVFNNGGCNLQSARQHDMEIVRDYLQQHLFFFREPAKAADFWFWLFNFTRSSPAKGYQVQVDLGRIVDFVVKKIAKDRGLL